VLVKGNTVHPSFPIGLPPLVWSLIFSFAPDCQWEGAQSREYAASKVWNRARRTRNDNQKSPFLKGPKRERKGRRAGPAQSGKRKKRGEKGRV